jgi:hypothetical protein
MDNLMRGFRYDLGYKLGLEPVPIQAASLFWPAIMWLA